MAKFTNLLCSDEGENQARLGVGRLRGGMAANPQNWFPQQMSWAVIPSRNTFLHLTEIFRLNVSLFILGFLTIFH